MVCRYVHFVFFISLGCPTAGQVLPLFCSSLLYLLPSTANPSGMSPERFFLRPASVTTSFFRHPPRDELGPSVFVHPVNVARPIPLYHRNVLLFPSNTCLHYHRTLTPYLTTTLRSRRQVFLKSRICLVESNSMHSCSYEWMLPKQQVLHTHTGGTSFVSTSCHVTN